MNNLKDLEKQLKLNFNNKNLLKQAFIHLSYLNESDKDLGSNERLEFLGDSILSFVISHWLYKKFPDYPEGDLTNIRSFLVKTESLALIAGQLHLGDYLFLSKGETSAGGQNNPLLLANTMEALIGAIFIDQGLDATGEFIRQYFQPLLNESSDLDMIKGFKSQLQEKIQSKNKQAPVYATLKEEGPDHAKTFTVAVLVGKKIIGIGKGKSKQAAEQKAAEAALEKPEIKD